MRAFFCFLDLARILSLLITCRAPLVIANPQQDFFAKPKCEPAMSHTCGVVEAICLQATLVFGLLRYARNDKNQMAARLNASRHDNSELVHGSCPRFLSLRRNVVTDAICLQTALVFGLLRYARNDKSQDRHTAFAMTIL